VDARISYARAENGASIAYALLGADIPGTPRIVISCGMLLGPYQMQFDRPEPRAFLQRLSQRAQVLVYDPEGWGLSGGDPRPWDPTEPDEIDAVTAAVGWDNFGLFGGFIDGPKAIAQAARRPGCVTDLLLWCSLTSIETMRATTQGAAIFELAARDPELFLHTFTHALTGWSDHEGARWLFELHSDAHGFHPQQFVHRLLEVNADQVIDRVRARTLVMYRRDSAIVDLSEARSTVQRIEGAQLALVDGESLSPFGEPMEPVVDTALDFFRHGKGRVPERTDEGDEDPGSLPQRLGLTERQIEVLRFLASGRTNREIALELDISVHTVDRHISTIYRRSGLRGRADATAFAMRNGLI
jgi:DNA-binding NarL/FixJ family response regulator